MPNQPSENKNPGRDAVESARAWLRRAYVTKEEARVMFIATRSKLEREAPSLSAGELDRDRRVEERRKAYGEASRAVEEHEAELTKALDSCDAMFGHLSESLRLTARIGKVRGVGGPGARPRIRPSTDAEQTAYEEGQIQNENEAAERARRADPDGRWNDAIDTICERSKSVRKSALEVMSRAQSPLSAAQVGRLINYSMSRPATIGEVREALDLLHEAGELGKAENSYYARKPKGRKSE